MTLNALRGLIGGGVDWDVRLERTELLPGRSAGGEVRLTARQALACRGVVAALVATEQWRHRQTRTDAQGHVSTQVVTETHQLQRLPVQLRGPTDFAAGEQRTLPLAMPVPGLGRRPSKARSPD
ncbi:MAG TPA: hypothetical protein VFW86_03575 [Candidatus Limnocylindrales bacterium]|nr:hypothetical protein [Candidatus Limnocylindrales bacterium]